MNKAKLTQLAQAEADAAVLGTLTGHVPVGTVASYLRRFRGVRRVKAARLRLAVVAAGGTVIHHSTAVFPAEARAAAVSPPAVKRGPTFGGGPMRNTPTVPDLASRARELVAANRDITNGEIAHQLGIRILDVVRLLHRKD